jgi:hypothetical protein
MSGRSPFENEESKAEHERLTAIVKNSLEAIVSSTHQTVPLHTYRFFVGTDSSHPTMGAVFPCMTYVLKTDADLETAKQTGLTDRMDKITREKLIEHGYPMEFVSKGKINFVTDEYIQRKARGNYSLFFR